MNADAPQPGQNNPLRRILSALTSRGGKEFAGSIIGKKILLVDDDPIIIQTFSTRLEKHGLRVVTASDGASAIGAVRDERPDLILLDVDFPPDVAQGGRTSWDGFQTMHWLRGLKEAGQVPFIIISAGDPALYKDRALAAGAAAFFVKGTDFAELLKAIRKALQMTGGGVRVVGDE